MLKKTKLNQASKDPKKVKERKLYKKLRLEFLLANPVCQREDCSAPAVDVHHIAGRLQFLNRVDTWMAVCRSCHDYIETNRGWAKEQGYLINPLKQTQIDNETS